MEWLIKRIAGTPSNDALLAGPKFKGVKDLK